MEKTRIQKIGRLIEREMGDLLRDATPFIGSGMITVTKVNVTPDLQIARVNVSIFGVPDKKAALEQLKTHTKELRFALGLRIRHQVRIIPELQFYLDDSLDYIENIDRLLKQ
ncbi:MAG: ribosome-binding factor [Bacteroidales bacterium]|jgi:ribosome-binding factor A|nr:ribosome-binding factor [Bacteroidales bacterium]MDN5330115.1 ribosome-binding factor [Bacteroidales bacterium]